ncbi:MAG: hypothetical protein KR126chlam6_00418 [Candidatus Anoxychlamydiales bacterium]|nr:hypothetical protein [Candidatus Anoxychlamydiales bacterium]
MKKALVYPSKGLGDGLLFLVLSNNLSKNGYEVDTYHPFLYNLDNWFKYTKIRPYPKNDNFDFLKDYQLIIINSDYDPLNKKLVKVAKEKYKDITFEIHPSACKGKNPPIGDLKFDFKKTVKENLIVFLENELNLTSVLSSNDITVPSNLSYRKYPKRVVIHPSSNDLEKNWPKEKFLKLFKKLKKEGFDPYFILMSFERQNFLNFSNDQIFTFNNLHEIASFIYESGFMIGNDSGIAHLASNLKIPTLTIFSTKRKHIFWRPSFYFDRSVISLPLLNIKGFRLREQYWKNTISSKRVLKNFSKLIKDFENYESSKF